MLRKTNVKTRQYKSTARKTNTRQKLHGCLLIYSSSDRERHRKEMRSRRQERTRQGTRLDENGPCAHKTLDLASYSCPHLPRPQQAAVSHTGRRSVVPQKFDPTGPLCLVYDGSFISCLISDGFFLDSYGSFMCLVLS